VRRRPMRLSIELIKPATNRVILIMAGMELHDSRSRWLASPTRERHCATVGSGKHRASCGFWLPGCDHPEVSVLVGCCLARFNQRLPSLPEDDREHRERTKRVSPPPAEYCVRAHNSVITAPTLPSSIPAAFAAGGVGVLGGLIGLGAPSSGCHC
jgi:hypothetical protein